MPILEIRNLTKYYCKTKGVVNLSLTLEEGEIFGFIGPNGAGKSTTIRSTLNLINKTSGEVYFNGKVFDKNDIEIKRLIGYLPSEINLYEDLTVKQMLDLHERLYNESFTDRRNELVARLRLDENKKLEDLSLGNSKKLGIVLALMHSPKLLILDEATSGLDPIIQKEFFDILKEEKQKGTTIFYSTHILSEISKLCDRVGIIKNGQLLKVEPVKNLLDKHLVNITITSLECEKILEELKVDLISHSDDTIIFRNTIPVNELLKKLVNYDISQIYIEQASLEDIFLHYYE